MNNLYFETIETIETLKLLKLLKLFPFFQKEFQIVSKIVSNSFFRILIWGGFPQIVSKVSRVSGFRETQKKHRFLSENGANLKLFLKLFLKPLETYIPETELKMER
jgi:hypothetical protein